MNDGLRWGLGIGGGVVVAVLFGLVLLRGPCGSGGDGGGAAADAASAAVGADVAQAGARPVGPGDRTADRDFGLDVGPASGAVAAGEPGRLRAPAAAGAGALAGLVLDRDGAPAAGVVVTVRPDELRAPWERFGPRPPRPPAALGAKRVDPDGFFRFEGLPAGSVVVEAGGAGFVAAEQRGVVIEPDAEGWVEFVLDAGRTISGRVTDREGRAMAGAEVSAWSRGLGGGVAITRSDGSYEVEGLRAGTYELEADADGYVAVRREDVRAGASGVDFRLGRSGALAGRVVWRGSGSPIEGAEVRAASAGPRDERMPPGRGFGGRGPFGGRGGGPSGATAAEGRFELRDVEPGRWVVEADAADRAPGRSREVTLEPGARVDDLLVELAEGARVTGVVVTDADGRPVAGATVAIEGGGGRGPGRGRGLWAWFGGGGAEPEPDGERSARTDDAGRFELRHVAAGTRTVVATHAAHPPVRRAIEVPEAGEVAGVELRMPAGGAIAGTVTDKRRGASVAEAFVVAVPAGGGGIGGLAGGGPGGPAGRAEVRAGGRYRLEGIEAGRYDVMVVVPPSQAGGRWRGPEFSVPQEAVVRSGETATVDFLLGGGTVVSGRVTQAGAPVPGAAVVFQPEAGLPGGRRSTVAGDDGRYVLEDVAPGPYLVRVERAPLRVVVPDVAEHELDLELPAGVVAGLVRDAASGVGVEDARVLVRTAAVAGAEEASAAPPAGRARSNADGSFEVGNLAPGPYELQVFHPQYADGRISVELPAGGRLDGVEIRIAPAERDAGSAAPRP